MLVDTLEPTNNICENIYVIKYVKTNVKTCVRTNIIRTYFVRTNVAEINGVRTYSLFQYCVNKSFSKQKLPY